MVDSGTSISLISKTFFDCLKQELFPSNVLFSGLAAPNLVALGRSFIPITLLDRSSRILFIICEKLEYDVILGFNFFHVFNPLFNYFKREFYLIYDLCEKVTVAPGQSLPLYNMWDLKIRSSEKLIVSVFTSELLSRVLALNSFVIKINEKFWKLGLRLNDFKLTKKGFFLIVKNQSKITISIDRMKNIAFIQSENIFECSKISEIWEKNANNLFEKFSSQLNCQANLVPLNSNEETVSEIKIN